MHTSDQGVERNVNDIVIQELRSEHDHELCVSILHMPDGEVIPRDESKIQNIHGQSERVHQEDERMQ
jgi:hypothetical protein